jgi:hypothetical protein
MRSSQLCRRLPRRARTIPHRRAHDRRAQRHGEGARRRQDEALLGSPLRRMREPASITNQRPSSRPSTACDCDIQGSGSCRCSCSAPASRTRLQRSSSPRPSLTTSTSDRRCRDGGASGRPACSSTNRHGTRGARSRRRWSASSHVRPPGSPPVTARQYSVAGMVQGCLKSTPVGLRSPSAKSTRRRSWTRPISARRAPPAMEAS